MAELLLSIAAYAAPKGDRKTWLRIIGALSCLVLAKLSNMFTPLLYGQAVDHVNGDAGFSHIYLWYLLGAYALARLGQTIFSEAKEFLFIRVAQKAVRGAALTAFRHLYHLSLSFHLDRQTGGLTRAIDRGAKGMEFLMTSAIFEVLPLFVELIFVSIILWLIFGWPYAVITFVTVVIYSLFTVLITQWRIKFRKRMNRADEDAATKAVDSLINYETVKYFNAEEHEADGYNSLLEKYEDAAVKSRTSLALVNVVQGAVIAIGLALIMGIAGYDIEQGRLSVGDFVAVNTYLIQLYLPLNFLGWVYRGMRESLIDLGEMFLLINKNSEISDQEGAVDIVLERGEIEFRNVDFSYNERQVLKDISFVIPPGKRVAIVGPSGAGKSTIARLLFRFYDPQKGGIFIDRQNISTVRQHSLRAAIAVVPQDNVMFNESIGYNIGYGRAGASQKEIEDAAKLAAIHSFISLLPEKYETRVGERGLKLSGGEKQRVAIARAILKQPTIYLFDEASSALDSQTERLIQQALDKVSKDVTTLVIAHRLSTIIDADEILVINDGGIAERGSHQNLLAEKGLYAMMWERQSKGFQDTDAPSAIDHASASRRIKDE